MSETKTRIKSHEYELQQLLLTDIGKLPFSLEQYVEKKSSGSLSGDVMADIMLLWLKRRDELIEKHNITEQEAKRVIYYQSIKTMTFPKGLSEFIHSSTWSSLEDVEKLIVQWIIDNR